MLHGLRATTAWAGGTPATGSTSDQLVYAQGSGSETEFGDWVSSNNPSGGNLGFDEAHRFRIEVVPGLASFALEIYDADSGIGGLGPGSTDEGGERDKPRGTADSPVVYRLFDPLGNLVTPAYVVGDDTGPPGSDAAWTGFYDSRLPKWESQSLANASSNVTSLTLARPAGTAQNDLLLASVATDGNPTISAPAGWTSVDQGPAQGNRAHLAIFYRVVGTIGSEPATYTFTWGGGQEAAGGVIRYSGADTTSPVATFAVATGQSASPTAPSVATPSAQHLVVRLYGADDDDLAADPFPAQHVGDFNIESGSGGGTVSLGVAERAQPVAGATGTAAFALSASEQWRAATVAIAPAATAPSPLPGHWLLEVDMSSVVSTGNDVQGFGLRARGDGGSVDLNLYSETFLQVGIHGQNDPPDGSRSYDFFPYITNSCAVELNDFDFDADNPGTGTSNSPPYGDLDLTSRSGAFTHSNATMSDNNSWQNVVVSGFTTLDDASDYGIWSLAARVDNYASGNYGLLYVGNDLTTNPPPASQPESDSFRLYLPDDTGGAPAKPYLAQYLTWVAGDNPPTVGNSSQFAVTVQVVNPTAYPITFDAATTGSNTVTTTIPAPAAFVTGSLTTTQGSASQSGGTVTWAPGTVAAGDTAAAFYRIDVTPAAAGNIPVTGTPASGGTTGTFVDETCSGATPACSGAQLADATATVGPLCELSVGTANLTPVEVADLTARAAEGGVAVEWETESEAATVGFELWREEEDGWQPVTEHPVRSFWGLGEGGHYRLIDPGANPNQSQRYVLVEIDSARRIEPHGPFDVDPREEGLDLLPESLEWVEADEGFFIGRRARAAAAAEGPSADPVAPSPRFEPASGSKVLVREGGWIRVGAEQIAESTGESVDNVRSRLGSGGFRMSSGGSEVAWWPASGAGPRPSRAADALEFYGQAIASQYTDDNVYFLQPGRGRLVDGIAASPPPGETPPSFAEKLHFEEDLRPIVLLPLDPESDIWFWDLLRPTGADRVGSFPLTIPDPSPAVGAALEVELQGASIGDHVLEVSLGAVPLGEIALTDHERVRASLELAPGLLTGGEETLVLTSVAGDLVAVDSFDLRYRRSFRARDGELGFTAEASTAVAVAGFASPQIRALDVSDPEQPLWLRGGTIAAAADGSWSISLGAEAGRSYFVFDETALGHAEMLADRSSSWRLDGLRADTLIIAPRELWQGATRFARRSRRDGSRVLLADLDDVYDEFADGLTDPHAIRDLVAWAHARWKAAPSSLVLVGAGNYDVRGRLGAGPNFVPMLLAARPDSLFPSDGLFGDVRGEDGAPETVVARIPARSPAELEAFLDKLDAYESQAPSAWNGRVVIAADHADASADYPADADRLAELLGPGYEPDRLYLDLYPDIGAARSQLFTALAEGRSWLHYAGHGGIDKIAAEGLLANADVPTLANAPRLPFVTASTCYIAFHGLPIPGFDSLGEELLLAPGGGAIAVWAPSWIADHPDSRIVGDRLVRSLFQGGERELGRAVGATLRAAAAAGVPRHALLSFQLLGDPGLDLLIAPDPAPPQGGGLPGE